jgi:Cu/Ag efflux pump CusA
MLKPHEEWKKGKTRDDLIRELSEKLTQIPGYVPGFLQPIENRILMISTGIRAQVGIKILGDGDLTRKLTVTAHAFSASARAKIEAKGGKCELIAKKHEAQKAEPAKPKPAKS